MHRRPGPPAVWPPAGGTAAGACDTWRGPRRSATPAAGSGKRSEIVVTGRRGSDREAVTRYLRGIEPTQPGNGSGRAQACGSGEDRRRSDACASPTNGGRLRCDERRVAGRRAETSYRLVDYLEPAGGVAGHEHGTESRRSRATPPMTSRGLDLDDRETSPRAPEIPHTSSNPLCSNFSVAAFSDTVLTFASLKPSGAVASISIVTFRVTPGVAPSGPSTSSASFLKSDA